MRKKAAVLAVLALVIGGVFATTSASAGTAEIGFPLTSKLNNLCLTVSDGNTGNGAHVIMVDCTGDVSQRWYWESNLRLRSAQTDKCLTVAWGNPDPGAAVVMWDCQGSWTNQTFYRPWSAPEEQGRIRSFMTGNLCLDISGGNRWQGASVQMWTCHLGANDYWNV
jgi:hypothetical protein